MPAAALRSPLIAALSFAHALDFATLTALVAVYALGAGFFTPAFESAVPDARPRGRPATGKRARPVRATDRDAARRAGTRRRARRCDGIGHGVRTRRCLVRRFHAHGARAPTARRRHARRSVDGRGGARRIALRAARGLALGDARRGSRRVPRVPRPHRGAASVPGEERAARLGDRARCGARRRRRRRPRRSRVHGAARPSLDGR